MSNEHDDYLTKGEVFLASIGREQEEQDCWHCRGTGEGSNEYSVCKTCNGTGAKK